MWLLETVERHVRRVVVKAVGVGSYGPKSDKLDAFGLAEMLRTNSVGATGRLRTRSRLASRERHNGMSLGTATESHGGCARETTRSTHNGETPIRRPRYDSQMPNGHSPIASAQAGWACVVVGLLAGAGCSLLTSFDDLGGSLLELPLPDATMAGDGAPIIDASAIPDGEGSPPVTVGNPVRLAQGQGVPVGMVADARRVYWIEETTGRIRALDKHLPGAQPIDVGQGEVSLSLAQDTTRLFWIGPASACPGFGVWSSLKESDAGATRITPCGALASLPTGFVGDTTHVYWSTHCIVGLPKSGGTPSSGEYCLTQAHQIGPLAASVRYFAAFIPTANGVIQRFDRQTQEVKTLGQSSSVTSMVLDGTHAYWTVASAVMRVALDATPPVDASIPKAEEFAAAQASPTSLSLHGESLFWVTRGDGTVRKQRKTDTTATTIATGMVEPRSVAASDDGLCWSTSTGEIWFAPF